MAAPAPVSPTGHFTPRNDWLARRQEAILEPELPIVDPHHHLVDRPETGRYLLPDLLADTGSGHNIIATVYLEWLSMYRAAGPGRDAPGRRGRVRQRCRGDGGERRLRQRPRSAPASSAMPIWRWARAVEKVLEAMIVAGGGRFRGIRFISASHPDQAAWGSPIIRPAGPADGPKVREGFARLAPLGLSFDAWMYHTQLGELIDLARAFPETPIVLDHVGGAIGLGPYAGQARRGLRRVERDGSASWRPAPTCMSSSAGSACGCSASTCTPANCRRARKSWPRLWRPYIETCIAAFGPERAMFESNFPVDKGSGSYHGVLERLQAHRRRLFGRRESGAVLRHREQILPAGAEYLSLARRCRVQGLRAASAFAGDIGLAGFWPGQHGAPAGSSPRHRRRAPRPRRCAWRSIGSQAASSGEAGLEIDPVLQRPLGVAGLHRRAPGNSASAARFPGRRARS